jgi:hypothetical protein
MGETAVIKHSLPAPLRNASAEDLLIVASPYETRDNPEPLKEEDSRQPRGSEPTGHPLHLEEAVAKQPPTGPLSEEYTSEMKFESFVAKTWNPSVRSSGNGRCLTFFDARIEVDETQRRIEIWADTAFYHRDAKLLLCKAHWCDVHTGATRERLAEDREVAVLLSARPYKIDVL